MRFSVGSVIVVALAITNVAACGESAPRAAFPQPAKQSEPHQTKAEPPPPPAVPKVPPGVTATIEDVVDDFNSAAYDDSKDGQQFPIALDPGERDDLISFLYML